jgi:hypothetical protein
MAQKTTVIVDITDDIDSTPDAKTVTFGLDDKKYNIDLGPDNEAKLREFLALFIGHARPAGRTTRRAATATPVTKTTSRSVEIREWARKKGIEVPDRGRISQSITDAYDLEHRTAHLTAPAPAPAPEPETAPSTDPIVVAQEVFEPEPAPAPLAF